MTQAESVETIEIDEWREEMGWSDVCVWMHILTQSLFHCVDEVMQKCM